jgi:hypothetical protein
MGDRGALETSARGPETAFSSSAPSSAVCLTTGQSRPWTDISILTGAVCRIANLSWYNRASRVSTRAHRNREKKNMKAWSIVGLVFAATIFATIPLSPQVTSRGLALNVDQAQAITYGHARRVSRRVDRRDYRQTRRAVRRGVY